MSDLGTHLMGGSDPAPGQIGGPHLDSIFAVYGVTGALGGALTDVPWYWALLVAVGLEVAERVLKPAAPNLLPWPRQDTMRDSVLEVGSTMLGFGLGRTLRRVW